MFNDINGKFSSKRVSSFIALIVACVIGITAVFVESTNAVPLVIAFLGSAGLVQTSTVLEKKTDDK